MFHRIVSWNLGSPYFPVIFWLLTALVMFAATSVMMWFGGIGGAFFGMLLVAGLCLAWLYIFIFGVIAAWKQRHEGAKALFPAAAPLAALAAGIALALPVMWAVAWSLDWGSFLASRSSYEDVARLAATGQFDASSMAWQAHLGTDFLLDTGPPRRLAFPGPGGFLDNWSGVVFDPTGAVMEADGFDPVTGKFAASDEVTKLFGGDLVSCRHMLGDFYHCSFT
jgi:hypothetical protein